MAMFSDTTEFSMRPVEKNDELFVFDLFTSVRGPELAHSQLTPAQIQQHLLSQFHSMHNTYAANYPSGEHFVVEVNNKDVGRLYINNAPNELRILDIIVDPTLRGQGIGSKVMRAMLRYCDDADKPMRFYVWHSNHAAQRFYARHGFQHVKTEGEAYYLFERLPR